MPRKKSSMANHHCSSSSTTNHHHLETFRTPIRTHKKFRIEERLHLLQHVNSSPSDTDVEDNNNNDNNRSRPRARLSFRSRGNKVWSMTSLLENCPASPSPICSPVSSHASTHPINVQATESNTDDLLFVTPRETSCLTETDAKKTNSNSPEEVQEETRDRIVNNTFSVQPFEFTLPPPTVRSENFLLQNRRAARFSSQETSRQYVVHEPSDVSESSNNTRARTYRQNWQLATVPSQLSSVGEWNLNLNERYYLGDDEESQNAGSAIALRVREMEAKFGAWKDARNFKFLTRLRKHEEEIENWEKKQIVKARQKVRRAEIKLEIKRRRALEKARKKIEKTQKKAEQRRLREQNATAKKIMRSNKAFEKISCTGKLLWKLACF